jgi:hypothetical protein
VVSHVLVIILQKVHTKTFYGAQTLSSVGLNFWENKCCWLILWLFRPRYSNLSKTVPGWNIQTCNFCNFIYSPTAVTSSDRLYSDHKSYDISVYNESLLCLSLLKERIVYIDTHKRNSRYDNTTRMGLADIWIELQGEVGPNLKEFTMGLMPTRQLELTTLWCGVFCDKAQKPAFSYKNQTSHSVKHVWKTSPNMTKAMLE